MAAGAGSRRARTADGPAGRGRLRAGCSESLADSFAVACAAVPADNAQPMEAPGAQPNCAAGAGRTAESLDSEAPLLLTEIQGEDVARGAHLSLVLPCIANLPSRTFEQEQSDVLLKEEDEKETEVAIFAPPIDGQSDERQCDAPLSPEAAATGPMARAPDLRCPVCLELPDAPFVTPCGHSFCYSCISQHMQVSGEHALCPVCLAAVAEVFPNHALALALRALTDQAARATEVRQLRKNACDSAALLYAVLQRLRARKAELCASATAELRRIEHDLASLRGTDMGLFAAVLGDKRSHVAASLGNLPFDTAMSIDNQHGVATDGPKLQPSSRLPHLETVLGSALSNAVQSVSAQPALAASEISRTSIEKRLHVAMSLDNSVVETVSPARASAALLSCLPIDALDAHMDDLDHYYASLHNTVPSLDAMRSLVSRVARSTRFELLASVRPADVSGAANIVSSIDFERGGAVFATAGVSRRIRMYAMDDVVGGAGMAHAGTHGRVQVARAEISCRAKLACVAWNPYMGSMLAAADYEGVVSVYDATRVGAPGSGACAPSMSFGEHEKRCWSVAWSAADPTLLASSSDDGSVRVWTTRTKRSIVAIDASANVCSVTFHPVHAHIVAFGCADHAAYVYDLRRASAPLAVARGHSKAVSYVRFAAGGSHLLTASTDCTLRLWDAGGTGSLSALRTLRGHINERNFVGLSVRATPCGGDLVACGSENNAAYVYDSALSRPLATHRFDASCPLTGSVVESALPSSVTQSASEAAPFVSSVAWAPGERTVLVAANSLGNLRVLRLC